MDGTPWVCLRVFVSWEIHQHSVAFSLSVCLLCFLIRPIVLGFLYLKTGVRKIVQDRIFCPFSVKLCVGYSIFFNLIIWTNTGAVDESVCYAHGSRLPAAFTLLSHELLCHVSFFLFLCLTQFSRSLVSSTALSILSPRSSLCEDGEENGDKCAVTHKSRTAKVKWGREEHSQEGLHSR